MGAADIALLVIQCLHIGEGLYGSRLVELTVVEQLTSEVCALACCQSVEGRAFLLGREPSEVGAGLAVLCLQDDVCPAVNRVRVENPGVW